MYGRGVPKRGFATAIVFMREGSQLSSADHNLTGDLDDAGSETGSADTDKEDAAALE